MWTGLIFAGGLSRRMGTDKALLTIGGRTLLERAVGLVREAGGTPVVLGPPRPASVACGARQVDDIGDAGAPPGPLAALRRGLREGQPGRPVLALACDVPLVPAALLRFLIATTPGWDAVVPDAAGEMQVLTAVYDPSCAAVIDRALARGERALHAILKELRVRVLGRLDIEPFGGEAIFLNVNTPRDVDMAESALAARPR